MKRLLTVFFLMVSIYGFGQSNYLNIRSRYNLIAVKTDSGFHVPGYSTIPNYRGGVWTGSGNVGVDTVNHKFYFYSGGSWREAGATYTFTNGLTESGGTVKLGGEMTDHIIITGDSTKAFQLIGLAETEIQSADAINIISALGTVILGGTSSINIAPDSVIFYQSSGNYRFKNLPIISSTTGRKVLVHDTATGKVERVDPALIGGGSAIEVTQAIAVSLANSSSLSAGSTYKITGVQPTLYDDGTSSGTTIFLKAETTSLFEKKGFGIFYNPKYDHNITGFGVADTTTSTTYSVGDTVYWGQYAWVCNTGGQAVATDILNLDGNWTKLPYSSVRYNAVLDEIEYDFENDWIVSRREADANNTVKCSNAVRDYLADNFGIPYYPISVFIWGNKYDYNNGKGVGGNMVTDSYFECTNLYDGSIYSNTLSSSNIYSNTLSSSNIYSNTLSSSNIYSNTLSSSVINYNTLSSSSIYSNTLSSSGIYSNTLSSSVINYNTLSSSSINSNTLSSSVIYSNTLSSSNIYSNTLRSSSINVGLAYNLFLKNIRYIMGEYGNISVDITSATVVFGDYPKTLFRLPDGTFKLRYYNNSGTLVVANITD